MSDRRFVVAKAALLAAVAMLTAVPATSQESSPPTARYTIDAGTTSGMAAMASGQQDGAGAALSMLRGGGGQISQELWLKLGTTRAPEGEPRADHFLPRSAQLGESVPPVLPPTQTECTVPAEVREAGWSMMMSFLYGYGPQADFAYPPRPEDAREPWKPEWIARVRFRSNTMQMLGMPGMGAFGSFDDEAEAGEDYEEAETEPRLPACRGGLRGIVERAAGLCE